MEDLNSIEKELLLLCPSVERLDSYSKPAQLTITITKNHNPDFKLFCPEKGRGIWIETKGHIRDRLYLKMLENFPPGLKKIYKVSLWDRVKREREKVAKRLDRIGIEYYHKGIDPRWLEQAASLYTGVTSLSKEELKDLEECCNTVTKTR